MRIQRFMRVWGIFVLVFGTSIGSASAQSVKHRISLLVDSSESMLLTPTFVTTLETCAATNWNGCTASGNPTAAQEQCNACMAWTIRTSPACASSFTATCRATYASCWRFINGGVGSTCNQTLGVTASVSTRGDGSGLTPGCDVDGDGLANDSRLYQTKNALQGVVGGSGEVEFALWRYAQVEGGQTCVIDANCPDTPGGQSLLTCEDLAGTNRCAVDASGLGSAAGQCAPQTWNGADATFSCSQCSDAQSERVVCEAHALDRIKTGGTSPLSGTVNCALPSSNHPFIMSHGALLIGGACDPTGAEQLVPFPSSPAQDNRPAIQTWIDHQQPNLSNDVEINAHGRAPIAASLRDLRAAVLESARLDSHTPCRRHQVIAVVGGGETCESVAAVVSAATSFQNLQFTNADGVFVGDYDVPVHVIGLGVCPSGQANCQTRQDLDAVAAAGGTGSAVVVGGQAELQLALEQIVSESTDAAACNAPVALSTFDWRGRGLLLVLVALSACCSLKGVGRGKAVQAS